MKPEHETIELNTSGQRLRRILKGLGLSAPAVERESGGLFTAFQVTNWLADREPGVRRGVAFVEWLRIYNDSLGPTSLAPDLFTVNWIWGQLTEEEDSHIGKDNASETEKQRAAS